MRSYWEKRVAKTMKRFRITEYEAKYNEDSAWINFKYRGNSYRFTLSPLQAGLWGYEFRSGYECFVQLVFALENFLKTVEHGAMIWINGASLTPTPKDYDGLMEQLACIERARSAEVKNQRF